MNVANGTNKLNTILIGLLCVVAFLWLVIPFVMAILWSLVDPGTPWSFPDILPPKLSFGRWVQVWQTTSLPTALVNSYLLAPTVAVVTLTLAAPTAFIIGRYDFKGRNVAQILVLLPMAVPGFVLAIFFAGLLFSLGIFSKFLSIMLAHTIMFMPFAIRILSVSFGQVQQDVIDAARDCGASPVARFTTAYLPVLRPGILASVIIVFVLSIEEFAIAFILGSPDFTTVPTILYSYLGYNYIRPNAAVVSLILVVPNVALMLILEGLMKSANPSNVVGKG
ncbi:ABC transporter permease [uncultured Tateyamaria sp.]|uniref:ABC transporter permease n=1 Tax=uncultured Tateyamaria sp. TaxID=455651 RepID=UPI002636AFB1|nr:ABC transporter permease [uncultured Tateyamaria sp.]